MTDVELEALAGRAHDLTIQRFGRTIKLYAPVYLSNSCVNACRYCGFNRHAKINRITLTVEEALQEADFLINQGHRHILLVAGENPNAFLPLCKGETEGVDLPSLSLPYKGREYNGAMCNYLEKIAIKLRPRVAKLLIEVQPFDEASYKRLADAGVDGVTLYQETYHRATYEAMHPAGPKSDFCARLEAIEAAGRAGMRFLGIGALLGLYDWRFEAAALIEHARALKKTFWQANISVSFPRIRDCASDFKMPAPVSDRELVEMIIRMRLALPDADLTISTREPAGLRDRLIPLGITQMSAGSATSPGGYSKAKDAGEQFHIEDTRPSHEFANALSQKGYQPVWKDWI